VAPNVSVTYNPETGGILVSPSEITITRTFDYGGGKFSREEWKVHLKVGKLGNIGFDDKGLIGFHGAGPCEFTFQGSTQSNPGKPEKQPPLFWNAAYDRVQGYSAVTAPGGVWRLNFPPVK
jgi:hypothetical protein